MNLLHQKAILKKRYDLDAGLISHIDLMSNYFKYLYPYQNEIDVIIPCIFMVLQFAHKNIDLVKEVNDLSKLFCPGNTTCWKLNILENYNKLLIRCSFLDW